MEKCSINKIQIFTFENKTIKSYFQKYFLQMDIMFYSNFQHYIH